MKELCKACNIAQAEKVCAVLGLEEIERERLTALVKSYLEKADMAKTTPQIMGHICGILAEATGCDDPYGELKAYYNSELLHALPELEALVEAAADPFDTALKLAISGNLIDFAAKHTFALEELYEKLRAVSQNALAIDDSAALRQSLAAARSLLYLGDNCGEIALDKLFIRRLRLLYPQLQVTFGVRGRPAVNDVTLQDAAAVKMEEVATVLSNGDTSLGTVVECTSPAFQAAFADADVIISKGQGNYESLLGNEKAELYFLFMAKCEIVAEPLGVPLKSIVCLKNRADLHW